MSCLVLEWDVFMGCLVPTENEVKQTLCSDLLLSSQWSPSGIWRGVRSGDRSTGRHKFRQIMTHFMIVIKFPKRYTSCSQVAILRRSPNFLLLSKTDAGKIENYSSETITSLTERVGYSEVQTNIFSAHSQNSLDYRLRL